MFSENFTLTNQTKGKLPSLPFQQMKEKILGKSYVLSLVFINPAESKKLNKNYRNKNNPTDILSFPISKTEGEIYIDIQTSKNQAPDFNRKFDNFLAFLFIHGLIHLKGFEHGSRMEEQEAKFRKIFGV